MTFPAMQFPLLSMTGTKQAFNKQYFMVWFFLAMKIGMTHPLG
jgi:hypothetical protein